MDIVERLRTFNCGHDGQIGNDLTRAAADEIERLTAECARYRGALTTIKTATIAGDIHDYCATNLEA